jgi:hypothetical protein
MSDHPSISIAFPCWNRGALLHITLKSIARQKYPGPVELVVVESGDDGLTEDVAMEFGAQYIRLPREDYPVFQSIAEMWNVCARESHNDILILQTAEVMHETPNVLADLVARVQSGPKVMATALVKDLAPDGSFDGWYNHPTAGSRPGWVSGAGPHAIHRGQFLALGGYEEMFYGYGSEDNYWMYLLRRNGFSIEYVESAVCAHQWHERTKYEPVTGYANRSLINILTMEIEDGIRAPVANKEPLVIEASVTEEDVTRAVKGAMEIEPSRYFHDWARQCWLAGNHNADLTFVAQRSTANQGSEVMVIYRIREMVTEAAWAVVRGKEAYKVAAGAMLEGMNSWSARAARCGDIHATWATMSLRKARILAKGAIR